MISNYKAFVPMVMGPGAASTVGAEARALGMSKVLFVHDPQLPQASLDVITKSLEASGIEYTCYSDVEPEVPDYVAQRGYEFASKIDGLNGIICLGGGSAMDLAKVINVLLHHPGPISRWYAANNPSAGYKGAANNPGHPIILLPSTAGTGSEQGKSGVVLDTATGTKNPVISVTCCFADLTILDPEMTVSCPKSLTMTCGLDAFCHAYEAYTGPDDQAVSDSSPLSDLIALEAMSIVAKYLPLVLMDGSNVEYRYKMIYAATLGMKAVANAHSHVGHSFAHAIGAKTGVPHGVCCWVSESHIAPWLCDVHYKKNKTVAELLGAYVPDDASPEELARILRKAMDDFGVKCGMPGLKHFGAKKQDVLDAIELMRKDSLFTAGKKRMTVEEANVLLADICRDEGLE